MALNPITGMETLQVLGQNPTGVPAASTFQVTTGQIAYIGAGSQYTANAATASTTVPATQIGGTSDVTLDMTGTLAAGGALTLPTVASLLAVIPNAQTGYSYNLRIINHSAGAFAWTVTTNTGWTLAGTMTIAQATFRDFVVTVTGAAAATLQQTGTGTAG